jgi:AI-2 transport protein TqsA
LLDALIHTSAGVAFLSMVFYTGIIILEGYVIVPLLMGRHMDLNATTVMLSCIFWELVWGVPGLFLAMPLMGAIKAVCEHVPGWEVIANLMSARDEGPFSQSHAKTAITVHEDPERTVVMKP